MIELKLPQVKQRENQDILLSAENRYLVHDYSQPDVSFEKNAKASIKRKLL